VGACCEGVDVVPCWTRLQVVVVVVVRCRMLWARATHQGLRPVSDAIGALMPAAKQGPGHRAFLQRTAGISSRPK
jgi:hypothetical protein